MTTDDSQAEQSAHLLSQANLHRMRQEWDEAITSSMQVLYSDPNNWRAHALLGDIYADQKRPDEAIRWYCMTLDIRPDSHSTRDKLNHLVTTRRQEFVDSLDPTRPLANRSGQFYRDSLVGKLKWQWSAPERKKRLMAASAVAAIIVVAVAIPNLTGHGIDGAKSPIFTTGSSPTSSTLFLQPVSSTSDTNNPSTSSPLGNSVGNQSISDSSAASSGTTTQQSDVPAKSTGNRDVNESALIGELSADSALINSGIKVVDAEIDPPTSTLSVTYSCDDNTGAVTPERILRGGLAVGKEALGRPEAASLQICVVRCLTPSQDQSTADTASIGPQSAQQTDSSSPTLAFVATLPRSASASLSSVDKMTDYQVAQTFSSVWWAQSASTANSAQPLTPTASQ